MKAHDDRRSAPVLRMGLRTLSRGPSPLLIGIVNVTPDSFSDGGRYLDHDAAVHHALRLVDDGADGLDLGGESTRPGAEPVPVDEELRRIVPVLSALRARVGVPISIDTTKAVVARAALDHGADVVNDVSGFRFDPDLLPMVATSACSVVLMHMQGEPRTMQEAPEYRDVVAEVRAWLEARLADLVRAGVTPDRVIVDPGIGFGKRTEHNLALLGNLDALRAGGCPILVGASRKRFLGALLDEPHPERRIEGDLAIAAHCRAAGVEMLRVHDVRAARRFFRVLDALDPVSPAAQ